MIPTTDRERRLVVLAAVVLAAIGHFWLRLDPLLSLVRTRRGEVERLERALVARREGPQDGGLLALRARRDVAAAAIDRDRAELERLLATSFPADEATALARVSELGEATGIVIRESTPKATAASGPADELGARPRRRLVLLASFASLRAFVFGLAHLPCGRVHVERLEVDTPPGTPDEPGDSARALVATLVIVL